MLSCENREIFQNTFFTEHFWATTSIKPTFILIFLFLYPVLFVWRRSQDRRKHLRWKVLKQQLMAKSCQLLLQNSLSKCLQSFQIRHCCNSYICFADQEETFLLLLFTFEIFYFYYRNSSFRGLISIAFVYGICATVQFVTFYCKQNNTFFSFITFLPHELKNIFSNMTDVSQSLQRW